MLDIVAFRKELGDGSDLDYLRHALNRHLSCPSVDAAVKTLRLLVQSLLDQERYADAAVLLWGPELFDPRPACVRIILRGIQDGHKIIFLGAAGSSKTYTPSARLLLDWIRDPEFTSVKVISTTSGHLKSNCFSTLQRLHSWSGAGGACIIPLEGEAQDGFIGLDPKNRYGAIEKVSIKIGENGGGALQGFHPIPRREPHPQFGAFSRLRVFLDEAEEIPIGVWSGLANTMTNIHGKEILKVICSANPKRTSSILAMNSEPAKGWGDVDIDNDLAWKSKEGWDVYRLDAARSENVVTGKVIYHNFMTKEGYDELRLKKGGNTPEYFTFARGMYPMAGVERSLIPMKILNGTRGVLIFSGFTQTCGGCDPAFEGDDEMVMFSGRFGFATGFRDLLDNVINFEKPRWALQIDQHYSMPKNLTLTQAHEVKKYCVELGITPQWFAIDQTGKSGGISEVLMEIWSPQIVGVTFGGSATGKKLLDESIRKASDEFATIDTEMHAAFSAWAEFGFLKIGPRVDTFKLFPQLSGRQYDLVGKGKAGKPLLRIESKPLFKRRLGASPDYGDAVCLLLHAARMNGQEKPSAVQKDRRRPEEQKPMEGDNPKWIRWDDNQAA